jgi:hypothetical protein
MIIQRMMFFSYQQLRFVFDTSEISFLGWRSVSLAEDCRVLPQSHEPNALADRFISRPSQFPFHVHPHISQHIGYADQKMVQNEKRNKPRGEIQASCNLISCEISGSRR